MKGLNAKLTFSSFFSGEAYVHRFYANTFCLFSPNEKEDIEKQF